MELKRKWKNFQERIAGFFEEVQRTGSDIKHDIKVVKTDMYYEFIDFIANDSKIASKYKLIIILQLSSASRISEILNLKKEDLYFGDTPLISIKILKKRLTRTKNGTTCQLTPKRREAAVNEKILTLLKEWVLPLQAEDYIFANPKTGKPYSREGIWQQYQQMFGSTTHGFRHSRINHMFEEHKLTVEEVANVMQFSTREVAFKYNNTNIRKSAVNLANLDKHKAS